MDGNRRWLGWIAIGLGALALVVALAGRGFGLQNVAGFGGANMSQPYAQQGPGPQSGAPIAGANAQQDRGRQNDGPQAGAQGGNAQQGQARPGRGAAGPGAEMRHGPGRPGDSGFGFGSWLRFPLKLLGGVSQAVMLALLILFGAWLLRGRGAAASRPAEPAQAPSQPLSPTGEAYTEEPSDKE